MEWYSFLNRILLSIHSHFNHSFFVTQRNCIPSSLSISGNGENIKTFIPSPYVEFLKDSFQETKTFTFFGSISTIHLLFLALPFNNFVIFFSLLLRNDSCFENDYSIAVCSRNDRNIIVI